MKTEEHTQGVGAIIMNLQALETVLRIFLVKANNQTIDFPHPGAESAQANYLTAFYSLGGLLIRYNDTLSSVEQEKYKVDDSVVKIRDAFAHGRLLTKSELPFTLWKFGPPINNRVAVEFCETLTADWLKKTWIRVDAEKEKVIECFKSRGYRGLT